MQDQLRRNMLRLRIQYANLLPTMVRLIESVKMRVRRYRNLQCSSQQAQRAAHELQEFKEALDSHAIVSTTDRAGTIIYANRKFCEISGYSHAELIGQNHRIIKGDMDPAIYADIWRTIASGRVWRGELRNKRKDGRYYWVESSVVPLSLDEHGVPTRYIGIRTEITALKEVQEALAESDERLKRSQYYANVGTWDWDLVTGKVICSERVGDLFGGSDGIGISLPRDVIPPLGRYHDITQGITSHPRDVIPPLGGHRGSNGVTRLSFDNFLGLVHIDDKDAVTAAIAACLDSGVALDVEHRVAWPDGSIHWLHHKGDVVRVADGQPRHLLGVVTDVTRRKHAEETLLQQKNLLEVLSQAVLRYIGDDETQDIAAYLLQAVLNLTGSEYGFLGEVRFDGQGKPYLYCHAVCGNAWDEVYEGSRDYGLEFRDPHCLIGAVLTSGKPVFSNDVAHDPRRGELPPGHRAMDTFLGVPVFYGDRLLAMYSIANRKAGYDPNLLEFLRPFDATVAVVMDALRRAEEKSAMRWQLLLTKEKAEQASHAKSEFLSRMSHELRTPLNAVLGFAQLLEGDPDEPLSEFQKESVDQILHAGWHLLTLINEVLDLSRIESDQVTLESQEVSVAVALCECVNLLTPMADKRQVKVVMSPCVAGAGLIRADETRFKQVLLNLLSNAIKYSRKGGEVRLFLAAASEGYLRIAVDDTGPGLNEEQLSHLFEAFNRMGAEKSAVEGVGIGLVIAKRLVEMMNGEIGVHSRPGVGSTFWVELPTSTAAKLAQEASSPDQPAAAEETEVDGRYKVLYVEDNAANLRVVERLLARHGEYQLISAPDAEHGVELARAHQPDLILMDINLPGMDGYAALKWLRTHEETQHIPVVALSADAMQGDVNRGMSAGFDAYIAKPVRVAAVLEMLRRFTSEHVR